MKATPLSGGGLISCQVIPPSCVVEKETMSNWTKLSPQDSASSFHPCWLSTNPRSGCPPKSPTGAQLCPPSWVRQAGPPSQAQVQAVRASRKNDPMKSLSTGLTSCQVTPPSAVRKTCVSSSDPTSATAQPVSRSIIWMDLKVTGTKGVEVGVALGKRAAVGTRGDGVAVTAGVGVGGGVLTGGLVWIGAVLGEGVSRGVGAGTQGTCAATSTVKSAVRVPFDKSFMGRLLGTVNVVSSHIVAGPANRNFQSELPVAYRKLLPPPNGLKLPAWVSCLRLPALAVGPGCRRHRWCSPRAPGPEREGSQERP